MSAFFEKCDVPPRLERKKGAVLSAELKGVVPDGGLGLVLDWPAQLKLGLVMKASWNDAK